MPASSYDITIEQGASFGFTITMTNEDATPFDLTSWTPRSMIRKKYTDVTATANLTTDVIPAGVGDTVPYKITVSMTPANTANIAAGIYVWDLEIATAANADVRRLLKGICTVDPEVTK